MIAHSAILSPPAGIKGKIFYAVPMAEYTSWRVGGPADCLIFPADLADLQKVLAWIRSEGLPYFILGKGTNILVRDGGFRGVVISLVQGFCQLEEMGTEAGKVLLRAEAGLPLTRVVEFCVHKGLSGLEFAAGIPGSVGGAIFMNAGAFGGEIKDALQSIWLLNEQGNITLRSREELKFSYRTLNLSPGEIILGGLFKLRPIAQEQVKAKVKEILGQRQEKQPYEFPSAGSVFRNPQAEPAGRLIEKVGLKGYQIGGAQVSEKHANFIINRGGAQAKDILKLIEEVRHRVYKQTGISLELEIKVIGENN